MELFRCRGRRRGSRVWRGPGTAQGRAGSRGRFLGQGDGSFGPSAKPDGPDGAAEAAGLDGPGVAQGRWVKGTVLLAHRQSWTSRAGQAGPAEPGRDSRGSWTRWLRRGPRPAGQRGRFFWPIGKAGRAGQAKWPSRTRTRQPSQMDVRTKGTLPLPIFKGRPSQTDQWTKRTVPMAHSGPKEPSPWPTVGQKNRPNGPDSGPKEPSP